MDQGDAPVNPIVRFVEAPTQIVALPDNALVGLGLTVRVTIFELRLGGQSPETITWYWYPFILAVAAVILNVPVVTPEYTPPLVRLLKLPLLDVLICHW